MVRYTNSMVSNIDKANFVPQAPSGQNQRIFDRITRLALTVFELFGQLKDFIRKLFIAEPLEIGPAYPDYKAKLIITGEKSDNYAIKALKKHTSHEIIFVRQDVLKASLNHYDLERDILIVLVDKLPGDAPYRLFNSFDGPLQALREAVQKFQNKAVLAFRHYHETKTSYELKKQLDQQLPDVIHANVDYYWRSSKLAEIVKDLFLKKNPA